MTEKFEFLMQIFPWIALITTAGVAGWVVTTWMRIKNGYPLETIWGVPLHPATDKESVERIVTDQPSKLARDIDALTFDKGGRA